MTNITTTITTVERRRKTFDMSPATLNGPAATENSKDSSSPSFLCCCLCSASRHKINEFFLPQLFTCWNCLPACLSVCLSLCFRSVPVHSVCPSAPASSRHLALALSLSNFNSNEPKKYEKT